MGGIFAGGDIVAPPVAEGFHHGIRGGVLHGRLVGISDKAFQNQALQLFQLGAGGIPRVADRRQSRHCSQHCHKNIAQGNQNFLFHGITTSQKIERIPTVHSMNCGNIIQSEEALNKSARADSERFFSGRRVPKRRNTLCISRFGSRTARGKNPLLSRRRFVQSFLNKSVQRHVIAGVDVDAVVGNAEVQMVAGGNAGSASGADPLPRADDLSGGYAVAA